MSELDDFCVYTIADARELKQRADMASAKPFSERKRWVTAHKLWTAAKKADRGLPVIFGDAARDTSRLVYWGILTNVELDDKGTTYGSIGFASCPVLGRLRS